MALDGKTSTEVDSLFRDAGLSNAKAQKFVDFYESKTKEAMEAPYQLWLDTQSEWVDKVKSDPEIGGQKLPQTLSNIAKYVNAMPNAAEFKEALNYTGAGNNPAIIKGLNFFARQMIESGQYHQGGQSVNSGKPARPGAKAMYPTLPSIEDR